jgi:exodeoxyribonuclease VII small subunit
MSSNSPVVLALSQKTNMSFEKGLAELERIVARLESNEIDLETALADFEQGMKIQQYCKNKLDEATLQVNRLLQDGKLKPLKDLPHHQAARPQQSLDPDDSLDFSDLE